MKHKIKIALILIASFFAILVFIGTTFYFWPTTDRTLQISHPNSLTYDQAVARISIINKNETASGALPECKSRLLTHGQSVAKTVVMMHGITACPKQFGALAEQFYDQGYNVYVPRAPYHGLADTKLHQQVTARLLADYADQSVTVATGLGREVGVIGLSGGAAVATWAAEYRPEVARLLVLSPFYEPAASQAPKWQLPLLKKLYGYHLLANQFSGPNGTGFSLYALANYMILTDNLKKDPSNLHLKTIGVVTSAADDVIDHTVAVTIPQTIADKNNLTLLQRQLPREWNVGHAIVAPDEKGVSEHQSQLFALYPAFYEGRQP